ncbi:MAG: FtsH protease activity modulator HflK [Pseudomonadota bacterium]
MPWTDKPGGSGNNGGGQGPWGQPNNGSGGQGGRRPSDRPTSDLEDLLKSGRDRFRRASGRGGGRGGDDGEGNIQMPNGRILGLGAVALFILYLFSGVYQVAPGSLGVVTTFGAYSQLSEPGLRWHVPWPIQKVDVRAVQQEQTVSIGGGQRVRTSMLTSDLNIVDVDLTVEYNIQGAGATGPDELPNVAKFLFNIERPDQLVEAAAESALRQVVGESEFGPIISADRAAVNSRTQDILQSILDSYDSGINVIRVNFGRADPPEEVIPAQREVIDARSEAERTVNDATRTANSIVPRAQGEARQIELDAEAYAQRVVRETRGAASRFNDVYAEYALAPEVTRRRMYLETMEAVLGRANKVIMDDQAGGPVPFLNLNEVVRDTSAGARRSSTDTSGGR